MLILSLAKKNEKFSIPFSMQCKWKETSVARPIEYKLYVYFDGVGCQPSQDFKNKIITEDIESMFKEVEYIDLNDKLSHNSYVTDNIEYTPTIIIEYSLVIGDEKIAQVDEIATKQAQTLKKVDGEEYKYIFVIDELENFTPDTSDESGVKLSNRQADFEEFINKFIVNDGTGTVTTSSGAN